MDIYTHIRVVIGIVIGLGLTHLLRGVARLIEHPKREGIWWVHLLWVLSMFLYLIHFWWFEFELGAITHWNFLIFLFLILYAVLLYVLCALLFPEDISDYLGSAITSWRAATGSSACWPRYSRWISPTPG